jgi:hypothetical protein
MSTYIVVISHHRRQHRLCTSCAVVYEVGGHQRFDYAFLIFYAHALDGGRDDVGDDAWFALDMQKICACVPGPEGVPLSCVGSARWKRSLRAR